MIESSATSLATTTRTSPDSLPDGVCVHHTNTYSRHLGDVWEHGACDERIDRCIAKLHTNERFLSLEVTPPLAGSLTGSTEVEKLYTLSDQIPIDAFVCTDSPLARFKPSSILSSIKLQNLTHKPLICTLSMRDRNSMALCGDILAANEYGLRAFLCLTGDPIKLGDCAHTKGVFEENSLKLTHIISELNVGRTISGKPLQSPIKRIYSFQVINSYANNLQSLKTKMRKKIAQGGVEALFTQPVYSKEVAEFLLESLEEINAQYGTNTTLIFGFFPVVSYKVALFLRDKLPGVFIPQSWIAKLKSAKDSQYQVGIELSRELLAGLQSLHDKIHFMSANKPELVREFYTL